MVRLAGWARHHRFLAAGILVGLIVGLAAGKAWAALDAPPAPGRSVTATERPLSGFLGPADDELAYQARVEAEARAVAEAQAAADAAWADLVALAVRIGRCEQPGNGQWGIDWQADGWTAHGHFAGGLGMNVGLYASLSGGRYAPNDPPEAQIEVFGRAWAMFGQRAWGCPG